MITNNTETIPMKRLYNVDFLRLLFVVLIVYYHFIAQGYVQDAAVPVLTFMKTNSRSIGFVGNAGLFIVSGYFLARTLCKPGQSFIQFATHRLLRFWPTLCFAVICMAICAMFHLVHFDIGQNILNLLTIHKNGLGITTRLSNLNASWFVCALFWISLFYYGLKNSIKNRTAFNLLAAVFVWFGMVLWENSSIPDYQTIHGMFPRGGMLALAMVSMGILLKDFLETINIDRRKINYWLATIMEIGLSFYLINGCLIHRFKETSMVKILAFCALFVLFIMQQGFLSRALNKPFVGKISRYAFSIYIMQSVGFVLAKPLWRKLMGGGEQLETIISYWFY